VSLESGVELTGSGNFTTPVVNKNTGNSKDMNVNLPPISDIDDMFYDLTSKVSICKDLDLTVIDPLDCQAGQAAQRPQTSRRYHVLVGHLDLTQSNIQRNRVAAPRPQHGC
jgi:hypothetical protein